MKKAMILAFLISFVVGPSLPVAGQDTVDAARPQVLQYAVKFICGKPETPVVAPGIYFTAINVHNPSPGKVKFRKKIAIALPSEKAGRVTRFFDAGLDKDEALEIDCPDILRHADERRFLKGFVVIESTVELDVVAVYTAAGSTERVETLFIERVSPRRLQAAGLPDLIPLNPQPSSGPNGFCRRDAQNRLTVTVKNQGAAPAQASQTTVKFSVGAPVVLSTPALAAGASADVLAPIPNGCFSPDCGFRITVDSAGQVGESNEANNTADGLCLG